MNNPTICPKCSYARKPTDTAPEYSCPSCGIVFAKYDAQADLAMRIDRALKTGNWTGVPADHVPEQVKVQLQAREAALAQQTTALQQQLARETLLLTTTPSVPGREIAGVLDIVSAECAYGMNILKDFFSNVTDVVGGRSGATQGVLRDARRTVMAELRNEAFSLGADAVVGVDLAYSEFSGGGKSMLFVVASGTAVKLAAPKG